MLDDSLFLHFDPLVSTERQGLPPPLLPVADKENSAPNQNATRNCINRYQRPFVPSQPRNPNRSIALIDFSLDDEDVDGEVDPEEETITFAKLKSRSEQNFSSLSLETSPFPLGGMERMRSTSISDLKNGQVEASSRQMGSRSPVRSTVPLDTIFPLAPHPKDVPLPPTPSSSKLSIWPSPFRLITSPLTTSASLPPLPPSPTESLFSEKNIEDDLGESESAWTTEDELVLTDHERNIHDRALLATTPGRASTEPPDPFGPPTVRKLGTGELKDRTPFGHRVESHNELFSLSPFSDRTPQRAQTLPADPNVTFDIRDPRYLDASFDLVRGEMSLAATNEGDNVIYGSSDVPNIFAERRARKQNELRNAMLATLSEEVAADPPEKLPESQRTPALPEEPVVPSHAPQSEAPVEEPVVEPVLPVLVHAPRPRSALARPSLARKDSAPRPSTSLGTATKRGLISSTPIGKTIAGQSRPLATTRTTTTHDRLQGASSKPLRLNGIQGGAPLSTAPRPHSRPSLVTKAAVPSVRPVSSPSRSGIVPTVKRRPSVIKAPPPTSFKGPVASSRTSAATSTVSRSASIKGAPVIIPRRPLTSTSQSGATSRPSITSSAAKPGGAGSKASVPPQHNIVTSTSRPSLRPASSITAGTHKSSSQSLKPQPAVRASLSRPTARALPPPPSKLGSAHN